MIDNAAAHVSAHISAQPALLDRHSEWRGTARIGALLTDPGSVVLDIAAGQVPVRDDRGHDAQISLALRPPDDADAGGSTTVFLGTQPSGGAVFTALRSSPGAEPPGQWRGLREIGLRLNPLEREILTTAVALDSWHETHRHCPRCGQPTAVVQAGWVRRCESDGSDHYPRTDPAIIVLLVDDADRALLARQTRWPQSWMSTLAGFVEPGESAESAVRREVAEEVGIRVIDMQYVASQPWPFPASLMLGYHASAEPTPPVVDGVEIGAARWFTRSELAAAAGTGEVLLPPGLSIANRLISQWYGAPLPSDWSRPAAR